MVSESLISVAMKIIEELDGEFSEGMSESSLCKDFNVLVTSYYLCIRLGDDVLWDNEDENGYDDSYDGILQGRA